MALFKFDENSRKWNELPTAFAEEDIEFYYYEVNLDSFSYFAIGEKEKSLINGTEFIIALVILIILVIVFLISVIIRRSRRSSHPEDKEL